MKNALGLILVMAASMAASMDFTGPAEWQTVHTNAVKAWCESQQKQASASYRVFNGVSADLSKKEVRILAEAVGHRPGITTEFLLVGPMSDRAYESLAICVASPGDIVRAVEALGIKRGGGVGSRPFRFWPYGERLIPSVRRLSAGPAAKEEGAACRAFLSAAGDRDGGNVAECRVLPLLPSCSWERGEECPAVVPVPGTLLS